LHKKTLTQGNIQLEQVINKNRFDAVLFDMDGVLTATASDYAVCGYVPLRFFPVPAA
jgi:hypothetical protein